MALSYDFDIYWPGADGEEAVDAVAQSGRSYVARFRDPLVVKALHGSHPRIKHVFSASGFGFDLGQSDLEPGTYAREDEVPRSDAVARLARNIPKYRVREISDNGFDLAAFVDYLAEAEAVGVDMLADQPGCVASFGRGAACKAMRELGEAVLAIIEPTEAQAPLPPQPEPEPEPDVGLLRKSVIAAPEDEADDAEEAPSKPPFASIGWAKNAGYTLALAASIAVALGGVLVAVPALDGGHMRAAVATMATRSASDIRAMQATMERQPKSRLNAGKGDQIIQSGGQMLP